MDWGTTLAVQGLHGIVYGMLLFLVASGLEGPHRQHLYR